MHNLGSRLYKDSLTRGFVLTSLLLLGVGLEQSLVTKTPSQNITLWFLCGNLLGLPVGTYIWAHLYPRTLLPLYFWILEGATIASAAWRPIGPIFFVSGLIFGVLLLHLFLLGKGKDVSVIIPKIGAGIIAGNLLLFILKRFPWPLGLAWLSIALAGWRISRPSRLLIDEKGWLPDFQNVKEKGLYWFWLFFLCFYALGGLYYSILDRTIHIISQTLFDLASLFLYVLGILIVIFIPRKQLRLPAYLAVVLMGLGIILQISPEIRSLWAYPLMDLSFGIADCLCISVIIAFSKNLGQAAIGFSLFPISIIIGLILCQNIAASYFRDYQWALAILFLTIIPLNFAVRIFAQKERNGVSTPLALPAPSTCKDLVPTSVEAQDNPADRVNLLRIAAGLGLSEREEQVFLCLVEGRKLKDIASDLGLAIGTIKALCNRVYEKAGVKGKKELIKIFCSGNTKTK